ncbi:hypothetical protein B0T24DRAFT_525320 [Lasiosphaeria ovina]|uniref:Aminoglycoside phosphotransferase domain-containing protein n=1 Tax=Lasiosphaeria ovina TaxID=92902 RepID=A0AAE0NA72_9PEZI|nr:hypothetical protein B0T24DRAFT_525320 [Lasiosphaeria ovina]
MVKFNIELVTRFPEEYGTSTEWEAWPEAIADYNALGELAAAVVVPEFDKGPFFIFHNQLEMNNILVDDEFNITGILDFTGTVGPLPTLCNFPWLFHMGIDGPLFSRRDYIKVFTTRVATNKTAQPPSALGPPEVRRHLIQQALDRRSYEQDIFNLWIVEHVPSLYFDNLGKEYRQKVDPEADAEMWARVRRGSKKRKEFQKKLMDGELVGPCPSCRENPLPEAGDSSA